MESECTGHVPYLDEHPKYYPPELIGSHGNQSEMRFQCYLIELQPKFQYDVKLQDIVLAVHERLDNGLDDLNIDLGADRGKLIVRVKYIGYMTLTSEQVALCQKFQVTVFSVLLDHNLNKLHEYDQYFEKSSYSSCELPPELCSIIMSPISVSTFYSFSFLPSIMHRIESLLIAANLKSMVLDHCTQNVIPTLTILEAITTKKCQEKLHLESLETLGDSFLKYAVSQQLFKSYQNRHEGLLSIKREKIICNATLCKLGCDRKITGFIRNEPLDPKTWIIPGTNCANHIFKEELLSSRKFYVGKSRKIKNKTVADVTEALIGAFLCAGGEIAALAFMAWLGINVEFRLEFLGDAVLDYLITVHLYLKYPGLSPGLLTDLRSASVNNDCYAHSAIKAELHQHILHLSPDLHRHIVETVSKFKEENSVATFGWESETTFPKVLGDVIESVAGAIFVDSGYDKEIVFRSMKPLLEPLITPETLRIHPVRELTELCQREHYVFKKPLVSRRNKVAYATVEVEAHGVVYKETRAEADKKIAKKLACKAVLEKLKQKI
ncbi:hypothetical protein DH2020_028473 [Rehmannia glutinosa]|uniref:RNase III domain-containing protein n=1 Tax=Rehmannia glutinosa TaxID=99300 RepID=A0ABR0VVF1_REHGL